jgi:hypothetical protein
MSDQRAKIQAAAIEILKRRKKPITFEALVKKLGGENVVRNAVSALLRAPDRPVLRVVPKRAKNSWMGLLWNRWSHSKDALRNAAMAALTCHWQQQEQIAAKMTKQLYSDAPGIALDDRFGGAISRLVVAGLAERPFPGTANTVRLTLAGWLKQQLIRKARP